MFSEMKYYCSLRGNTANRFSNKKKSLETNKQRNKMNEKNILQQNSSLRIQLQKVLISITL